MESKATIATLKGMLETREFNKNFADGVGELVHREGEKRLKQTLDLGFVRTEDGEYFVKENNKISTRLLNCRICNEESWIKLISVHE